MSFRRLLTSSVLFNVSPLFSRSDACRILLGRSGAAWAAHIAPMLVCLSPFVCGPFMAAKSSFIPAGAARSCSCSSWNSSTWISVVSLTIAPEVCCYVGKSFAERAEAWIIAVDPVHSQEAGIACEIFVSKRSWKKTQTFSHSPDRDASLGSSYGFSAEGPSEEARRSRSR
jgi:hypothetical protein